VSPKAKQQVTRAAFVMMLVALTFAFLATNVHAETLMIDFNSNQDGGGDSAGADPQDSAAAHNQAGWSSYHANHEVAEEFTTATYGAISVTPAWPNTTSNKVMQSMDRNKQTVDPITITSNDANWDDTAGDLNLITDMLGIDTRTGNGGNGDWDGTTGTPT